MGSNEIRCGLRAFGDTVATLLLLAAAPCAQQAPDPEARPVVLQILESERGLPMPGVPVHFELYTLFSELGRDGYLTPIDRRLTMQRTRVWHSDPEGRVELILPQPAGAGRLVAGAPFVGSIWVHELAKAAAAHRVPELRVHRLEQFSVQVTGPDGEALAHFPVALHGGGRDVEVAWTNETGLAVFGLPDDFEARLRVCPAGWFGPRDDMPTVARQLRRERAKLQVPAFGYVQLRALVDGEPCRVPFTSASARSDDHADHAAAANLRQDQPIAGVRFGPIAVGRSLQLAARAEGRSRSIASDGPTHHGEVCTVDVDFAATEPERAHEAKLLATRNELLARLRERPAPSLPELAARARREAAKPFPVTTVELPGFEQLPLGTVTGLTVQLRDEAGPVLGGNAHVTIVARDPNVPVADSARVARVELRTPPQRRPTEVRVLLHEVELVRAAIDADADGPVRVDVSEFLTERRLRIVDGQGVPLLGAIVSRGVNGRWLGRSDERGEVLLLLPKAWQPQLAVRLDGYQLRILPLPDDGARIVLDAPRTFSVEVLGLPDDLPKDRLAVTMRSVDTGEPVWTDQVPLGDCNAVELPEPLPGNYLLRLVVCNPEGNGYSVAVQRAHPVTVRERRGGKEVLEVEAAGLERLRELLGR